MIRVIAGVVTMLYQACTCVEADPIAEVKNFRKQPKHFLGSNETMKPSNFDYAAEDTDPLQWPKVIHMSPDHSLYVSGLVQELIAIILDGRTLDERSASFGVGTYFFEKDPRKPSKTALIFGSENFPFKFIKVSFSRPGEGEPWNRATMSVHPRNHPIGTFDMNLPKSWFENWELRDTSVGNRENSAVKHVNTFCYQITRSGTPLTVKFSSRPDVSDLTHGYPKSFHMVTVERKLC